MTLRWLAMLVTSVVVLVLPSCRSSCRVDGKAFLSKEMLECGLAAPGESSACHWEISFDEGEYAWSRSDLFSEGAYACEDGLIMASDLWGDYEGEYDPRSGTLVWADVEYERR